MSARAGVSVRVAGWMPLVFAAGLLSGCHHKPIQPLVLPQSTPVPLATDNRAPAVLQEPAKPKLPEVPVAEAATKPKRVRRRAPKPPAQTASGVTLPASVGAQSASVAGGSAAGSGGSEMQGPSSEASAAGAGTNREIASIGALTAGDEQNPNTRREVLEMLSANERRLAGLPADVARSQATLVSKVRTFQRDAQQALDSGDVDGAKSLATKGKLLLDDLAKPVG